MVVWVACARGWGSSGGFWWWRARFLLFAMFSIDLGARISSLATPGYADAYPADQRALLSPGGVVASLMDRGRFACGAQRYAAGYFPLPLRNDIA